MDLEYQLKVYKQLLAYIEQGDESKIEHILHNEKFRKEIVNMKSSDDSYLLHKAAHLNQHVILQILLNYGANVDTKNSSNATALHWATSAGNLESCEVLLNYGSNILSRDENQHSPLHLCFLKKNPFYKVAQLLLLFKADTNFKGNNGSTCLHICAQEGNVIGVKWLLKKETTKINSRDNSGQTPLMRAITSERFYESKESVSPLEMVKYLLSCGADYKILDENSRNILSKAVLTGRIDILQFFKSYLDQNEFQNMLNSKDLDGKTLLHHSVVKNDLKIVRYLLSQNIDMNISDNSKLTPLQYAIKYDDLDIESVLRKDLTLDDKIQLLPALKKELLDLSKEKEKLNRKNINSIFKLASLSSLNLSTHPGANFIPNFLQLKTLILSDCQLRDIPQGIEALYNLQELNLSHNHINLLSPKIYKLEGLTNVDLSFNQLYQWPREMNGMNHLKSLNLAHNSISFEQNVDIYNLVSPRNITKGQSSSFFKKKEEKLEPQSLTIRVTADNNKLKESRTDLKSPKSGDSFIKSTFSFFTKKTEQPEFKVPPSPREVKSPRDKPVGSPKSPRGEQGKSFLKNTLSFFTKKETNLNLVDIEEVKSPREEFCPSLTYLNLSENDLKEIPREMCEFERLIEFDLSKNPLKSLPQSFLMLRTLKKLNISHCGFSLFPTILSDLKGLTDIDISYNSLEKLSPLVGLTNLKSLNISCCFLKNLPERFLEPTTLTKLVAIDNQISELTGIEIETLEHLDLSDNNLESVNSINTKNLTYLNLSRNSISTLSSDICKLKLKTILLSGNQIKELPLEFPHLRELRVLDLSNNRLKEFSGMDNFTQLESLNLRCNELKKLTLSKCLQFLTHVDVSMNYLSEFKGFLQCNNLISLNASDNLIQELEQDITHAKKLVNLDLNNNEISSLPKQFEKHLYSLQTIKLNDNNIYEISTEIQEWIRYHGLNFEYNSQAPLLISEGIYLASIGACNNKKLLSSYNIKSVLWIIRKSSPRIHYPDDFKHEILYFDPQKDNMTNTFIHCKNFSSSTNCAFSSDEGYEISGVFIIAMLILSKNYTLSQAMNLVLNIKKFEISDEYMQALQRLEKEKTKKADIKIILENLSEREQFRIFCQDKKMDKYVSLYENIQSAYKNSLDKFEKLLFSQEIVDEALNENGSAYLNVPKEVKDTILHKIEQEHFEKTLFDELEVYIEKELEPFVPEFRKSTLSKPIKVDKLSMFSARKTVEKLNPKDELTPEKPKSQPITPRSNVHLSPKQSNSAPLSSKGDTSPLMTPRDFSKVEPQQIKFEVPLKVVKKEDHVDYDSVFDSMKIEEVPSPRGSLSKVQSIPKLDFSGVKK